MNAGSPPVRRTDLETTDPELGHRWINEMYVAHTPRLSGPTEPFRFRVAGTRIDGLRLDLITHTMTAEMETDVYRSVVAAQLRGGRLGATAGRRSIASGAGGWCLFDTTRPMQVRWEDVAVRSVILDLAATRSLAGQLTGRPAEALGFPLGHPVDRGLARYLTATCDHVQRDLLPSDALMANPLIRHQVVRTLTLALLASFPNAALDALLDPLSSMPVAGDPATVRRAVAFVDEHAGEPIGVEDIADAARVGVRALQLAFRKHRDTTPLEYLRRVRLDRAHRDLQDADPTRGDTVAGIATRWGFAHPGTFAIEYRRTYGRPPSATLRG
jgi:AraC-like DNA-binding protein